MKKSVTLIRPLLIVLFYSGLSIAQVSGKVIYTSILESEDFKSIESILIFDSARSLFYFSKKDSITNQNTQNLKLVDPSNIELEFNIGQPFTEYHEVFIDRSKNEILAKEQFLKNGKIQDCITYEPMNGFDWTIQDESKVIGAFTTKKATTSFRGRNYTAWFAEELPVNAVPWKFHGLPGLIIEVTDDENGVQFYLSSIEIPYKIDSIQLSDTTSQKLSIEEYASYEEGIADEIVNMIRSKLPRGTEISTITAEETNKGIEREYKD